MAPLWGRNSQRRSSPDLLEILILAAVAFPNGRILKSNEASFLFVVSSSLPLKSMAAAISVTRQISPGIGMSCVSLNAKAGGTRKGKPHIK